MRESDRTLDSQFRTNTSPLETPSQSREHSRDGGISTSERGSSAQYPAQVLADGERERVIAWLQQQVSTTRLEHILRVEQMAIALAQQHHLNVQQAAQAGLMHDLAKFFKPVRLLQMAQSEGLAIDPVDLANPHLLHADVGAIVARDEFGVQDSEVLDAIRNHTLGRPGMSLLSCVVFLADSLEPERGDTPELKELRQISERDLYRAVWLTCDYSLRYLLSQTRLIHPRMVLTRNWAINVCKQSPAAVDR